MGQDNHTLLCGLNKFLWWISYELSLVNIGHRSNNATSDMIK
jgi:hypothetical protein